MHWNYVVFIILNEEVVLGAFEYPNNPRVLI